MLRRDLTPAMEDYLKAVYLVRERDGEVSAHALAHALDVAPPSVTAMVKRLATLGLIQHEPYRRIALTPAGEKVALEVVRHHRLLELYLAEFLGMPWETVHAEADRLEHYISEDLEERIAERLGQPDLDPHGDPIPTRELAIVPRELRRLSGLAPDEDAVVARIEDQDPALLRYLSTLGLVPGAVVRVVAVAPYGGVITVQVAGNASHGIGNELAARLLVAPVVVAGGEPQ